MAKSSIFSYNLTRPYPAFVTPTVLISLVIFTFLFSLLNIASAGYSLVVVESTNPNATVDSQVWMRHWPSFLPHKLQASCQTVELPVGSQFFTNHTALRYTLTNIWQSQAGGAGGGSGIAPSLRYYNNILENCSTNSIEIDLSALDRSASQQAYSEWGAVVRSYATCTVFTESGATNINLTQEYDYVPSEVSFSRLYTFLGTNFLSRNETSEASLYWGESIMSMYWAYISHQMKTIRANQTANSLPGIRKGTLYFYKNDDRIVNNLTDPNFFEVDFRFIVDKGQGDFDTIYPGTYGEYRQYTNIENLMAGSYPNIWQSADTLAKAAYSTVLVDLGSTATPNMLTDPDSLNHFTSNFTEARRNIDNAYPGPSTSPYGAVNSGSLTAAPSVIASQYLCQVPRMKSGGNLFVSILVADLVFLQTLWLLFRLALDKFYLQKRPAMNYCQGCIVQSASLDMLPETPRVDKLSKEVELTGLRVAQRPTAAFAHERSISEQALLRPQGAGLGYRDTSM